MNPPEISEPQIIRPINSLLIPPEKFFIPKYQRGYRWTEKQVTDLLVDVDSFSPITRDNQQTSWYCLQPLVIKKNGDKWNLVDGQQRLTTIYLILYYLREGLSEAKKEATMLYSLEYETRKSVLDWVAVFDDYKKAEENIDFLHIHKAYQTIKKWFHDNGINEDKFRGKLLEDCKFIWYDIEQDKATQTDEEKIFIRLNVGKIRLTNAELIKALFLNRSNFDTTDGENIRLRQLEISSQWDRMEEELSDDAFWYFINGRSNSVTPRINYLFYIIAEHKSDGTKEDSPFRYFQTRFDNAKRTKGLAKFVKDEWKSVHLKYQILRDWFRDRFYYHHIGFLLTSNPNDISELLEECTISSKDKFNLYIINKIRIAIDWNGIEELGYDESKDKSRIKWILLLQNILTTQRHEKDNAWFPFNLYHSTDWDIEHIQAIADPELVPKSEDKRKAWLNDAALYICDDENGRTLKAEVGVFSDFTSTEAYSVLYDKIIKYFSAIGAENANPMSLSNLTLLDYKTNRGYGNAVFPVKRAFILEKDKNDRFRFIPICTKNVFHKYHTQKSPGDWAHWTMADRENYINDIKATMKDYLSTNERSN